jgi:hypothetical protein
MFDLTSKYPMAHRIRIPRPYVPSFNTDIRKTFAREWHRLACEAFARELGRHPRIQNNGLF